MSAYLDSRGLQRLRFDLSQRDLAVLDSVAEHRFLTAAQIACLHFSEHATKQSAARVTRRVLARLTAARALARIARRIGGVRAGSASFVYTLGPVGRRLLDRSYRASEPSALFLDHTLAVADAHVQLVEAARAGSFELLEVQIEPKAWRRFTGSGGAREILRPDLYAVTATGDYEHLWFVEVDRGTESPAALSRKLQAYETYRRSGREQQAHGVFPLVVWAASDAARVIRIEKVIASSKHLQPRLFRVCLQAELAEGVAGGGA